MQNNEYNTHTDANPNTNANTHANANAIQYKSKKYNAMQCNAIQYSTVHPSIRTHAPAHTHAHVQVLLTYLSLAQTIRSTLAVQVSFHKASTVSTMRRRNFDKRPCWLSSDVPCKVVRPGRWPLQLLPMSARVPDCRRAAESYRWGWVWICGWWIIWPLEWSVNVHHEKLFWYEESQESQEKGASIWTNGQMWAARRDRLHFIAFPTCCILLVLFAGCAWEEVHRVRNRHNHKGAAM